MLYLSNKKKMNPKIKRQGEIVEIVKNLKEQGKKVVTYNGSFDILHLGHIKSLEEAKAQGDIFINGENLQEFNEKKLEEHYQAQIGMIFQAFYLINNILRFSGAEFRIECRPGTE